LKSSSEREEPSNSNQIHNQTHNQTNNVLAMLSRDSDKPLSCNQSVQTNPKNSYDMSTQANFSDIDHKKQVNVYKKKVKELEQIISMQAKTIVELES
jgi:hypothetical protein